MYCCLAEIKCAEKNLSDHEINRLRETVKLQLDPTDRKIYDNNNCHSTVMDKFYLRHSLIFDDTNLSAANELHD